MRRLLPCLLALCANAASTSAAAAASDAGDKRAESSALDGQLFYQLLLGEIRARSDDPGAGYSLVLDAARKTSDPALFQRAIEIAFSARAASSTSE